jgi:hypothetical protein
MQNTAGRKLTSWKSRLVMKNAQAARHMRPWQSLVDADTSLLESSILSPLDPFCRPNICVMIVHAVLSLLCLLSRIYVSCLELHSFVSLARTSKERA